MQKHNKTFLIITFVFSTVVPEIISFKGSLPLIILINVFYRCIALAISRDCDLLAAFVERHARLSRLIDRLAYLVLWSVPWLLYRIELFTGDARGYSRYEENSRRKETLKKSKSLPIVAKVFLAIMGPVLIWVMAMMLSPYDTEAIDKWIYRVFHLITESVGVVVMLESLGVDKRDL